MPQVTVIIPTYNRSDVLRCALHSLCSQTYADFEAWIVGDACTDDSEAVVEAFGDARFKWTNLEQRSGSQVGPNNEGLRRAQGAYVAYLGHDDLWFPWHLASLMETIAREDADFVYGGVVCVGPDGAREVYGDVKTDAYVSVSPPSGWLHRRVIVDRCGPWREPSTEPTGFDVAFQARAFLAGFRFARSGMVSVLKFPSHWWGTYARHEDYPQDAYGSRMAADPLRLQAEVLTDLAYAYARQCDTPSVTRGLGSALRATQRGFVIWYGVDRWPLSHYLRWRGRRRRRRTRVLRGLPAPPKGS